MNFVNSESIDVNGTSLRGLFYAKYDELVKVFGRPTTLGDGYKIQVMWHLRFDDGTVATIYDWKEGDAYKGAGLGKHYTDITMWHCGGYTQHAVEYVTKTLGELDF